MQTSTGKEIAELSERDREKLQRYSFLQAKRVFEEELKQEEKTEADQLGKALGCTKAQRKANRDWVVRLDLACVAYTQACPRRLRA